ncbi:MAG: hypothetical protein WAN05_06935 [Roseiarcus sp.]
MPEQPEILLRLEALRRDIDSRARASVLWFIFPLAVAFGLGVAFGRFWK